MKLKTIIESKLALENLMGVKLPIKASFRISKFLKDANTAFELFESSKQQLFEQYGVPTGGGFKIEEENVKVFNEEMQNLLHEDVDIDCPTISIEVLGDVSLEPSVLYTLDWMFTE